jgi:hypothetical protein
MKGGERLALGIAVILFGIYFVNVALGAARIGVILNDVGEMLVLFSASIFFVIAVLGLERKARASGPTVSKQGGES